MVLQINHCTESASEIQAGFLDIFNVLWIYAYIQCKYLMFKWSMVFKWSKKRKKKSDNPRPSLVLTAVKFNVMYT